MNDHEHSVPISSEAITNYFEMPDLLRDLLLQLSKDFQTAQIPLDIDVAKKYTFEVLCINIEEAMKSFIKHGGSLKNLLIRVDLTEKQLKKTIPTALHSNLGLLSSLIIKRELQKVVIRHWYRLSS